MARTQKLQGLNFPSIEMKEKKQPLGPASALDEHSIRERALLVRFSIGRWYGAAADDAVVHDVRTRAEASGDIGSFTKRLMKRERLIDIARVTNDSRRYHKLQTMPWSDPWRLLPVESFLDYKNKMTGYEQDFNLAVDAFFKKYKTFVEDEKKTLGRLWKASDYPDENTLRARFRFGLAIDPLPDTNDLRIRLSKEQSEEIKREFEQRMRESLRGTVTDIYQRIGEQIEEAKGKLDSADSKLRTSMFDSLREILSLLPRLNILNDPNLNDLADSVRKDILIVPVSTLRDDPKARNSVSKKAAALLGSIAALQKGAMP